MQYKANLTVSKVETINHTNSQNWRLVRQPEQSSCYLTGFGLTYSDSGNIIDFFIFLGEVFSSSQKITMLKYSIVSFSKREKQNSCWMLPLNMISTCMCHVLEIHFCWFYTWIVSRHNFFSLIKVGVTSSSNQFQLRCISVRVFLYKALFYNHSCLIIVFIIKNIKVVFVHYWKVILYITEKLLILWVS